MHCRMSAVDPKRTSSAHRTTSLEQLAARHHELSDETRRCIAAMGLGLFSSLDQRKVLCNARIVQWERYIWRRNGNDDYDWPRLQNLQKPDVQPGMRFKRAFDGAAANSNSNEAIGAPALG